MRPENCNVLDLGCGTGTTSFYFASKKFKVTGIDISETAIRMANDLAKKQNLEINFQQGDVLNLQKLNNKFDIIYDSHCLHCIVFDEDRQKVLNEIKNSLKQSGIFILDTMAYSSKMNLLSPNNDFLRFDENYILWHQTKELNVRGSVSYGGKNWCAQRKVSPADKIIDEVLSCGFKIVSQQLTEQPEGQPMMLRMVLV